MSATEPGQTTDAQAAQTTDAGQQVDKGNFGERFRADPEWAMEQFKQQQSRADSASAKLEKLASLQSAAELVSPGDLGAGAQRLLALMDVGYRIEQDPSMKALVEKWQTTGQAPQANPDAGDAYTDPDEEIRTLKQTIQQLEGRVNGMGGEVLNQQVRSSLDAYFQKDEIGRLLNADERGKVIDSIQSQVGAWQRDPNARGTLQGFNEKTVDLLATNWIKGQEGKLRELATRMRDESTQRRRAFSTDSPGGLAAEEVEMDPSQFSGPTVALDAFRAAKARWGS